MIREIRLTAKDSRGEVYDTARLVIPHDQEGVPAGVCVFDGDEDLVPLADWLRDALAWVEPSAAGER